MAKVILAISVSGPAGGHLMHVPIEIPDSLLPRAPGPSIADFTSRELADELARRLAIEGPF